MPTSVHIPATLLAQADKRAKSLGISRNRLIVQALSREVQQGQDWSPGFIDRLQRTDSAIIGAVQELSLAIRRGRRSKPPLQF